MPFSMKWKYEQLFKKKEEQRLNTNSHIFVNLVSPSYYSQRSKSILPHYEATQRLPQRQKSPERYLPFAVIYLTGAAMMTDSKRNHLPLLRHPFLSCSPPSQSALSYPSTIPISPSLCSPSITTLLLSLKIPLSHQSW